MIGQEEFIILYRKYLNGECSLEEIEKLERYHDGTVMPDDEWNDDLGDQERLFSILKQRIHASIIPGKGRRKWYATAWFRIAATILIILSVTLGIIKFYQQPKQSSNAFTTRSAREKIQPGGNKAYLTMANGSVITLNGTANGLIASQSCMKVNKVREGLLKYTGSSNYDTDEEAAFNLIATPRGGQYEIVLADRTHVWLNSATSLKYPTSFKGNERRVELSGEAYFEVVKNPSKPFIVAVNGMDVRVLGTHFNVMGYNDDGMVKTTLLEGIVKLTYNGKNTLLKPGQQGALDLAKHKFDVANVDAEGAVAWKNGLFAFDNEDIQTIMKRISRWYDVDVVFPENFKRKSFGGTVSRFDDVSQVLKSLQLTGSVHFKIDGRRIIVMP